MARQMIATLLTDFGTRDHSVGAMKGVILSLCPDVVLVDLTHEIPAHDVLAGSLELGACYLQFPPATVFLAVVDPGVGSARRGIAADAGPYRFVAPDNGVLTSVFADSPPRKVVSLTERKYARPTISKTFEGRDRFAPAAAWLAKGVEVAAMGSAVRDYVILAIPRPVESSEAVEGCVLRVDRFGNLVTNIPHAMLDRLASGGGVRVAVGSDSVLALVETYAGVAPGEACALVGGTGFLEIAVNGGRAADRLQAAVSTPVTVVRLSSAVLT